MKLEASLNYFEKRRNKVQIMEEECAIYALEKQIPKKPILKEYGFFGPYPFCSCCDNALINTRNDSWHKEKFCPNCGQKIDWSEVEE